MEEKVKQKMAGKKKTKKITENDKNERIKMKKKKVEGSSE